jgi:hypothetical protein
VQKALDERVNLINRLTDLARKGDWKAVRDGIQVQGRDEHATLVYLLILQRANDQDNLTEMLSKLN